MIGIAAPTGSAAIKYESVSYFADLPMPSQSCRKASAGSIVSLLCLARNDRQPLIVKSI
jgi:hypothetical protein